MMILYNDITKYYDGMGKEGMDMAQATITFKTDQETKEAAQEICRLLGINMTTAINLFLHQMIRRKGIPFDVVLEPSRETKRAILEAEQGIGLSRAYDTVEELMEDIRREKD